MAGSFKNDRQQVNCEGDLFGKVFKPTRLNFGVNSTGNSSKHDPFSATLMFGTGLDEEDHPLQHQSSLKSDWLRGSKARLDLARLDTFKATTDSLEEQLIKD